MDASLVLCPTFIRPIKLRLALKSWKATNI